MKKSLFIFLAGILLFGGVSATISNVHISPEYPNLSSNLIKVYADVSDVSKATLYYKINDDIYSSYFSISKGVSSFIYDDVSDNVNVIYWITGDNETTEQYSFIYDGSPPVLNIIGDNPLTIEINSSYNEQGASASDSVYGDLTSKIVTSGIVDANAIGEYAINYTVSDLAGNMATATRIVNVVEIQTHSNIPASSGSGGQGESSYSASSSGSSEIINDIQNASTVEIVNSTNTPSANTETKGKITGGVINFLEENKGISIIVGVLMIAAICGYVLIKARIKRKLWGKLN